MSKVREMNLKGDMDLTEQTTDATRYRFPGLYSPSHHEHIANLEKALVEVIAVVKDCVKALEIDDQKYRLSLTTTDYCKAGYFY